MKSKVYIETTIVSYLTSRPSRDLIIAAHQQITKEWWETRQQYFEMYISQLVVKESMAGDENAAKRRIKELEKISILETNEEALKLSKILIDKKLVPQKAVEDAIHVSVATVHGMDYLLTWNCTHIANAEMRHLIEFQCSESGYQAPVICTPEELMGGQND